jgi:hypothetical protein
MELGTRATLLKVFQMIKVNLNKAKDIAHKRRRSAREKEFEPWDSVISKQIPGNDLAIAESKRQEIRDKYAQIQIEIDSSEDVDQLSLIIRNI